MTAAGEGERKRRVVRKAGPPSDPPVNVAPSVVAKAPEPVAEKRAPEQVSGKAPRAGKPAAAKRTSRDRRGGKSAPQKRNGPKISEATDRLGVPPKLTKGGMRIVALGGIGEIGRNMTVFEYDGRLLIVDCGVLFPEDAQPGVDLILPDFRYIEDRIDDVEAIVLTHGHEDHIGAVPFLLRLRPQIPVIGSKFTSGPLGREMPGTPSASEADRGHRGRALDPRSIRL